MIIRYEDSYQEDLIKLILTIQQEEFGLDIGLEQQSDLLQIGKHYQENGGQFWLARVDGKVVGSIALIALENGRAALKKMFVAKDYRKTGLGRQLVNTLVDFCKEEGIEEVYLGTTQRFVSAQRFYRNYGFEKILKGSLPNDFPLLDVDDTFYVYKLR